MAVVPEADIGSGRAIIARRFGGHFEIIVRRVVANIIIGVYVHITAGIVVTGAQALPELCSRRKSRAFESRGRKAVQAIRPAIIRRHTQRRALGDLAHRSAYEHAALPERSSSSSSPQSHAANPVSAITRKTNPTQRNSRFTFPQHY